MGEKAEKAKESTYGSIAAAIVIAVFSAIIGYVVNFVDDHRKSEIAQINTRIEKLYGPLYALSVANQRSWSELQGHYRGGKTYYFNDSDPPTAEQTEVWRRWMKTVFLPLDSRMEEIIVNNAQLFEGNKVYTVFSDLIAHVESYKATIAKWKDTDDLQATNHRTVADNTALIEYPIGVDGCINDRLQESLKYRENLEKSWTGLGIRAEDHKFADDCS